MRPQEISHEATKPMMGALGRRKDKPRGRRNPEANVMASRDDWIKGGEDKKESVPILAMCTRSACLRFPTLTAIRRDSGDHCCARRPVRSRRIARAMRPRSPPRFAGEGGLWWGRCRPYLPSPPSPGRSGWQTGLHRLFRKRKKKNRRLFENIKIAAYICWILSGRLFTKNQIAALSSMTT